MLLPSVWAPPWRQPGRWLAVDFKVDRPSAHNTCPPWLYHRHNVTLHAPFVPWRARTLSNSTPSALPATTAADTDWSTGDQATLIEGDYGYVDCSGLQAAQQPSRSDGCGNTSSPRLAHPTTTLPSRCKIPPSHSMLLCNLHAATVPTVPLRCCTSALV